MSTPHQRRHLSTTGSQIASAVAGGVAGVGVGLVLAQAFGGLTGIVGRFRHLVDDMGGFELGVDGPDDEFDDDELDNDEFDDGSDDEAADDEFDDVLGERVLEAFRNDPTLAERAIDIDVGAAGTIELTGQVDADREVEYAATLAGGVPGVHHVVTRLGVKGSG
ncbi:MAG: BON domain-containing protein [Gemmatimonadaceae bacterium]